MLPSIDPKQLLIGAWLALLACLTVAAPALADQQSPRLGLTPIGGSGPYFELSLRPGESRQLSVEVANFGDEDVVMRTFAADGYTIINGGFAAELFGEPASGTTLWLDYPTRQLSLATGERHIVDFSVSVPSDADPGEYITGLVAENVTPYGSAEGGVTMQQINRTVVAVAIDVPGPRAPAFHIGAVSYKAVAGMSFVAFEIVNGGNVLLKPLGRFSLQDVTRAVLADAPAVMDSVYAGTETLLEVPLAPALKPGDYCAQLWLKDVESGISDATECLPFTVVVPGTAAVTDPVPAPPQAISIVQPAVEGMSDVPLLAGAAAIASIVGLGVLYVGRRRRSRRSPSGLVGPV